MVEDLAPYNLNNVWDAVIAAWDVWDAVIAEIKPLQQRPIQLKARFALFIIYASSIESL